jgi:hypothetical protein
MIAQRGTEMSMFVLVRGKVFDGISDVLTGPAEILVEGNQITSGRQSICATRSMGDLLKKPRLLVAAHIISSCAGHGDLRGFYASHWNLPLSAIATGSAAASRLDYSARLLESQPGTSREELDRIAIAEIAQKVRLHMACGEVLILASRAMFASPEEFLVQPRIIKARHRAAIQAKHACRQHEIRALQR